MELNELFNSFQGEYPYTGRYSTFIRFNICNLECPFCDTMRESKLKMSTTNYDLNQISDLISKTNFITFTGGEPLLFVDEISEICNDVFFKNIYLEKITIETNGINMESALPQIIKNLYKSTPSVNNLLTIIWSPKFYNDEITIKEFNVLFDNYTIYDKIFIKIIADTDNKQIIESFIKKAIELYGINIRSKINLMFKTDKDLNFIQDSINFAIELGEKYSISISDRLHLRVNVK